MPPVFFHGTDADRDALLKALARHCECVVAPVTNIRTATCPGHRALVEDQAFVDRLCFMRHQRALLMGQEFSVNRRRFL